MSAAEVRLAALEEGNQMGLFCLGPTGCFGLPSAPRMLISEENRAQIEYTALLTLRAAVPLPLDELQRPVHDPFMDDRFELVKWGGPNTYLLTDRHNCDSHVVYFDQLCDPDFDIAAWLTEEKLAIIDQLIRRAPEDLPRWSGPRLWPPEDDEGSAEGILIVSNARDAKEPFDEAIISPELELQQTLYTGALRPLPRDAPDIRTLERSATRPKATGRVLPRPIVILVHLNRKPCRALLDSGSLTDFVSTTIVDQLKLKYEVLDKPIPLQLAMSGSRSSVKAITTAELHYQDIRGPRTFDIANLETYF
jgi:hypothetical protein